MSGVLFYCVEFYKWVRLLGTFQVFRIELSAEIDKLQLLAQGVGFDVIFQKRKKVADNSS